MLPLIIVYQIVTPIAFLWPIFDAGIPGMAAGKKNSTDPLIIFFREKRSPLLYFHRKQSEPKS
jgi:hypothetical protein